MRTILFIFGIFLLKAACFAQDNQPQNITYDFDTTLKGGYSLYYKVNDSMEYLYLKKGKKIITELSSMSVGLPHLNPGYISADFTNYFVLVHSFGNGNPHHIELFKKSTGENIIKSSAVWIDVDEKKQCLLYCEAHVPNKKDQFILLNVQTGRKEKFSFPSGVFGEPQVLNRIHLKQLTTTQLIVQYDTEKGEQTKVYYRK
ncbi:MAG: hypothetical protein JST86_19430 [Bacteroidetes bacterium]|nr:hypothetical protein [Bacteroidota bacterium]